MAFKLVRDNVNSCPLKLGKVTFWNEDQSGPLFLGDKMERDMSFCGPSVHEFKDDNILNDSLSSHENSSSSWRVPKDNNEYTDDDISHDEDNTLILNKLKDLSMSQKTPVSKVVCAKLICPVIFPFNGCYMEPRKMDSVQLVPAGMDVGLLNEKEIVQKEEVMEVKELGKNPPIIVKYVSIYKFLFKKVVK
ncbi:unnamed protein product [Lepeophtheirus salmonis]|uniref:(salmon louse) hypothetical protein n=1 Tax=Lepeophtheirus salmonis TaxID=72036 RepID=A0A7R8CPB3_LEPSM|nr:unnamed protein product [Lepeophtheirus salmonis]CAF2838212.1 unnamed protein product [Lepeophtheirus salmonis]